MMFSAWSLCVTVFLFTSALAQEPSPQQYCVYAIYEAYTFLTFEGTGSTSSWTSTCKNSLKATSMYAAAEQYCEPEQITRGYDFIRETCIEEAGTELLDLSSIIENLTASTMQSMEVVGYGEISKKHTLTEPVLISTSYYERASKSVAATYNTEKNHRDYGWALYGYWGGILLLGILNNLWQYYRLRQYRNREPDTELLRPANHKPRNIGATRHWIRTHLMTPTVFGTHHARLLYYCTIPTRIQALVIVTYWILMIIFCGVGYYYYEGSLIYSEGVGYQRWKYFADRCANLLLANLPILWLFATRNNIFIFLTGWDFQTFNMFHRHIARVVILLAIGHGSSYTHMALVSTTYPYAMELQKDFFRWGIVAATTFGVIWIVSNSWFRHRVYDLFLALHICLAILIIYALFRHTSHAGTSYSPYLWTVVAFWTFDKFARLVRIVFCNIRLRLGRNVVQTTSVTAQYERAANIVKVDIRLPGTRSFKPAPGQYCFLYQPTQWRFHENHPFSIGAWFNENSPTPMTVESPPDSPAEKTERMDSIISAQGNRFSHSTSEDRLTEKSFDQSIKLTFWIRPYDGWTRRLRDQCLRSESGECHPKLFLEGPYGNSDPIHMFDSAILIVGGSGITAAMPYITDHFQRSKINRSHLTNLRLVWSARTVEGVRSICATEFAPWIKQSDFSIEVFLTADSKPADNAQAVDAPGAEGNSNEVASSVEMAGITMHYGRPSINALVMEAAAQSGPGNRLAVFSCGPAAMTDSARAASHSALKAGHRYLEYFEDSFGW